MENTLKNKATFSAQYWGQKVGMFSDNHENFDLVIGEQLSLDKIRHLRLRPLSTISDEDAIEVAKLSHQMLNVQFKVLKRDADLIHITWTSNTNIEYHVSIRYKYAAVNSNVNFLKNEKEDFKTFKHNIGEITLSSERPVPYVAIVDFLRSKGYAIPYMGLSVDKLVDYGWVALTDTTK